MFFGFFIFLFFLNNFLNEFSKKCYRLGTVKDFHWEFKPVLSYSKPHTFSTSLGEEKKEKNPFTLSNQYPFCIFASNVSLFVIVMYTVISMYVLFVQVLVTLRSWCGVIIVTLQHDYICFLTPVNLWKLHATRWLEIQNTSVLYVRTVLFMVLSLYDLFTIRSSPSSTLLIDALWNTIGIVWYIFIFIMKAHYERFMKFE